MKYIAPTVESTKFTCPHCQTLSQHKWTDDDGPIRPMDYIHGRDDKDIVYISTCNACEQKTIWMGDKMVYPQFPIVEPNPDMTS